MNKEVKDAAMRITATKDGQTILRYLCHACGTFDSGVVFGQAGFDSAGLEYNEGRRSVYIKAIRPLIEESKYLGEIERSKLWEKPKDNKKDN